MSRYIDADLLKSKFEYDDNDSPIYVEATKGIHKIIDACPTANVVHVKPAHWEWCEEIQQIDLNGMISTYTWSGWKCSHCKESIEDITRVWSKIDSSPQVNYCPHCGAKMDGKENDNE